MSITGTFTNRNIITITDEIWQYDYGQTLELHGLTGLNASTPVHFAIDKSTTAEVRTGTYADGILTCAIPDAMFEQANPFWAYVFVADGTSGETRYGVLFNLHARGKPTDTVTPDNVSAYDELVARLNALIAAVGQTNETATASAAAAKTSETNANTSATEASQALLDLLAMLGVNVATLTNGKLTPSQIPDLSINDVLTVANADELLALNAQRGDVGLIIVENVVTDSYILAADDPTTAANWKKLGVSYVANAGHANTADESTNATMINNKRIVAMTQAQYDVAVIDTDTYYFVTAE